MKEYLVRYVDADGEEILICLPSFWKLLFWFLRKARRCQHIVIMPVLPATYETINEDPCDNCLRWDECNGVDRDVCPRWP